MKIGDVTLQASSKHRYRATASERRAHGGSTVTDFFVWRKGDEHDPAKWLTIRGYGRTPGERKTDAMTRAAKQWGLIETVERAPLGVWPGRSR